MTTIFTAYILLPNIMVEHRKYVDRSIFDKIIRPFKAPEETVITNFVPINMLIDIIHTEGGPLTVLNIGIRDLMMRHGISYDMEGLNTTVGRIFKKTRITRMAFILNNDQTHPTYLVAETDSLLNKIEDRKYDPNIGNIRLFKKCKNEKKHREHSIDIHDHYQGDGDIIYLTKALSRENEPYYSGIALLSGYRTSRKIHSGEEVMKILKDWTMGL